MHSVSRAGLSAVAAGAAALLIAACSSSSSPTTSSSSTPSSTAGASSSSASISLGDLNNTFSAMANLKSLASSGKGGVEVILPDTTTSTRYVEFDAPY
ncbi:MAG: hypothetical protein ACRDN0_32625, partial [Trebonia sp.]